MSAIDLLPTSIYFPGVHRIECAPCQDGIQHFLSRHPGQSCSDFVKKTKNIRPPALASTWPMIEPRPMNSCGRYAR